MNKVAIIGAGPGGLAAARWLQSEGFRPVIFERGPKLGGQWSLDPQSSGIWDGMRTNTTRITTAFSDLEYPAATAVYPTNREVLYHLVNYAEMFSLAPRYGTTVKQISRDPGQAGWQVSFLEQGSSKTETFDKVVVASGRYNRPLIPEVPGLASFRGSDGVAHTFDYAPQKLQGKRVVVGGGAVSALEIAADLAMHGAEVTISLRRQRYVLQKLINGQPSDHIVYTRFAALTQEVAPQAQVTEALKQFVLATSGNPEQYGAPRPADTVEEAGVSLSQYYLPMVAEGKIRVMPWMQGVEGQRVIFADGRSVEADAIVFGTGFALHLPFLDEPTRRTLDLDATHMDLDRFTFHPDLPGMAFLGLYELLGPYFPALELHARWIAYAFSGTRPMPPQQEMRSGVEFYRAHRHESQRVPLHFLARIFAQQAGVEPDLAKHPELARALLFGPLSTVSYRIDGPDALPDAGRRTAEAAAAFGVVDSAELPDDQRASLAALARARRDPVLEAIAAGSTINSATKMSAAETTHRSST